MKEKFQKLIPFLLSVSVLIGAGVACQMTMEAMGTHQEIRDMEKTVAEFQQKAMMVNQAAFRPVRRSQVPDVQRRILGKASANGLYVQELHEMPKESDGFSYKMTASGTWEGTARFIQDFHAQDALLAIRFLSLGVENGSIITIMEYKIYTKD